MKIEITGHNIDLGDALRTHVTERLNELAKKYYPNAVRTHVIFELGAQGHGSTEARITSHISSKHDFHSTAEAMDAHAAFDAAFSKMETQWRRYKRKLKDYEHKKPEVEGGL